MLSIVCPRSHAWLLAWVVGSPERPPAPEWMPAQPPPLEEPSAPVLVESEPDPEHPADEPVQGERPGVEAEPSTGNDGRAEAEPSPRSEPPPPALRRAAAGPAATDRPPEPRIAGRPRTGTGLLIAGGTMLGAGIASTITFAGMTRGCDEDGPLECRFRDQDRLLLPLGASATVLGAMLLGMGIGYRLHYRKWQRWSPTVSTGGAGLEVRGRF